MFFRIISYLILMFTVAFVSAQDMLLKGGHVIDVKNDIDEVMDISITDGKISGVGKNLRPGEYTHVVDVAGMYVVPGLIDIHSHNFHGTEANRYLANSFTALPPDGFTFRAGVTTIVDAGGAGWRNFEVFKRQTIDRSKTRMLAFLNIVGSGMAGGAIEQNVNDMDAKLTAMVANQYKDDIIGIKLAHYYGPEWIPTERAVEAGRKADIPVMIDFGGTEPELSLNTLFMEKLRPGDIFTHCFGHVPGRIPLVNDEGKLQSFAFPAQKRGIIFDVGHGGGSFRFDQVIPALAEGFKPNSISTDLHTGSMNGGMKDMLNVMSKFINMGMTIEEVIERSTWNPAKIIQREELGHLSVDAIADVAVLRIEEGDFGFVDVTGYKIKGNRKFVCELTLREGAAVWDLNGITKPLFKQ